MFIYLGSISSADLVHLSSLQRLNLQSNKFSNTIPSSIVQLTSLTYIDLSNNSFISTIPYNIGQLTNVTYLSLGIQNIFIL